MSNYSLEDARAPSSPPPAPPLPPEKYGGFAATALARLAQPFGYGYRPPSANGHRPPDPRQSRLNVQRSSRWAPMPLLRSVFQVPQVPDGSDISLSDLTNNCGSPVSSRSATHRTDIHIASLDISPDRTHAVLAGRDVLKTIQVSDTACAEDFNLRTNIIAYAATHETSGGAISAKHKEQLVANDVKWSHGAFSTTIATAGANGQIVVYDINRAGVEIARLHEHARQVHRLGFNPHQGAYMLSGSQDGTVRMWDLRALAGDRSVMTCQSHKKYTGNSESIRDLKWSPTDGTEFAVGTDNGTVQCWDTQKPNAPRLKIAAHEKSCHSVDWHPDGKYIVSGGGDKNIRVWDSSSSNRRMKPSWEIRAPQSVVHVRWRPACYSSDKQGHAGWRCTQLAASYDQHDPRIHVWDFCSPYIPFRVLDKYDTPATALLWHSESLLWSVGSAGMFTQTDMKFVAKTRDQRSPNTLDIAPDGKILIFSQERERRRTSIEDVLENLSQQNQRRSSNGERLSVSHSTAQGSFESLSFKPRQGKNPSSLRSTKSLAGTPPSAGSGGPVLGLDLSLEKGMQRLSQVAQIGYIQGVFDADAFKFLARYYKAPSPPPADHMTCDLHLMLSEAFRSNSTLAARTSQYRLAQSWQILAQAVENELRSRAEYIYQQRTMAKSPQSLVKQASLHSTNKEIHDPAEDHETKMSLSEHGQLPAKVTMSHNFETASNMTTPLARPVPDSLPGYSAPLAVDSLQLPDSTWTKKPPRPLTAASGLAKIASPESPDMNKDSEPDDDEHSRSKLKSEYQPYQSKRKLPSDAALVDMDRQLAERRAAMGNYRATPRPLLRLDDPTQLAGSGLNIPIFERHDSNESFQLFSASTDSSHRERSVIGSFESNPESQKTTSTPEREAAPSDGEDYGNGDQEDALVFDDEAQMRSPGSPPASPPKFFHAQRENKDVEHAASAAPAASHRPTDIEEPIVHYEDMEDSLKAPGTPINKPSIESHKYILSDFLPPEQEPDFLSPCTATAMFMPLIDFHTYKLHDAQLPAYLLLHLAPYINHIIPYYRAMTILQHYHTQLVSLQLHAEAAELRKLAHPRYPEVAENGLYDIAPGGPWCTACQKPNNERTSNAKYCERCKQPWADCPICIGHRPASLGRSLQTGNASSGTEKRSSGDVLWGWCQECGHGGHMGCLRIWWDFDESEGACPTVGCLCDCMPGTRRDEIVKELEEGRKPKVVSKDEWKVRPSPAVQKVRGLVGGPGAGKGPAQGLGGGRGAMSLGAAGRSGSGGKKVRIVAPEEEERKAGGGEGKENLTSASAP
ncbi:hypothetical protein OEA41_007091 [Lepraria neglecta]|uniref:Uncharacterized protein n=1 Tax=Lepraria neglecta TaxID=209136 RepID=A0AAD9Z8V6_9LECA|nr:hypothetical protein OEA41_007091 [Lepraria neglecta]